ncbi:MAG: hypothetical protein TEF_18320 [Rhizobiales bacterium NRL2]|nr:MAG: hypothetical protein TEF_18320 [Rhizobiales bacterium NRL2]
MERAMLLSTLRAGAAGVGLIVLTLAPAAMAQPQEREPGKLHISVEGTASAVPDVARVSAGVVAEANSASEAMTEQRARMNRIVATVRDSGVDERDIQTAGISLSPIYHRNPERSSPRINGYRATNRVNITVRDLKKVGAALDALVAAGANDIGNISFAFSEQEQLLTEARTNAVAALEARRDFYARTAGLKIGRLLSLSESGGMRPPRPMEYAMRAEAMDSAPTPVSPGESEVSVGLSAVYEIEE